VLALKRRTGGYEDNKALSDEEPFARFMTVALAYARSLLVAGSSLSLRQLSLPSPANFLARAVYTHLLLLSTSPTSEQVFWRWLNVFLIAALWAIEIRLGQHMDDEGRWKSD
jgi:hypothetical protein